MNKTKSQKENEMKWNGDKNWPDKELKVRVIRILSKLGGRMDELSENFNKEMENLKMNQLELKNTISEMKNTLEGINSRLEDAEEWINSLEDRVVEIIQ